VRLLHAGCGGSALPEIFNGRYEEVRLDIDPEAIAHIYASITDMGDIGEFDAVYSSHCVEHLYPDEVRQALAEFYRVTKAGGSTIVIVPDLEGIEATDEVILESAIGPLSGLDLIYGCRFDRHKPHMAHHSGFVSKTLEAALRDAGFSQVTMKRLPEHNLMGVARK
jgi:ubiquinone/menaquinone biosynthesis C-methylase UbiE